MNADTLTKYIALQGKFREAGCKESNCNFTWVDTKIVFIPLTCDDSSEEAHERSLWGMVDGLVTVGKQLFAPNSYFCTIRITDEDGNYKKFITFKGATPTDALLAALIAQWNVEVKE